MSCYPCLEDGLAVSYKAKHNHAMWCRSHALWYLPKWAENLWSHKSLNMNANKDLIYNCQNIFKEQPTYYSIGEWIKKLYIPTMEQ